MEKVIAVVPVKSKSERVSGKNFVKVAGKPLYSYVLDRIQNCNFDDIYVDSDSEEIADYCSDRRINYIHRKPALAENSANGNDLLEHHISLINAKYYFQLFVTAPLLRPESINGCIDVLVNGANYDSILTCRKLFSWYWYDGKPINYNPKFLPRSQDAEPIIEETTGLYGITRDAFNLSGCRIGLNPYFFEVAEEEALDLDTQADFEYLKYYVSKSSSSTTPK